MALRLSCLALLALAAAPAWGSPPGSARAALRLSGEAFRAGRGEEARRLLDPWLARSPAAAREALALDFLARDYPAALALALSLPAAAADEESRLWVARSAAGLGRWQDCLLALERLERPGRAWPLCLRAEALEGLGEARAREAWAQALQLAAGTRLEALAAFRSAEAARAAGDLRAAEPLYLRAEKADRSYSAVNLRLGSLYAGQKRWAEARRRLEKAAQVDPGSAAVGDALKALLAAAPGERQRKESAAREGLRRFAGRPNPCVAPLERLPGEPAVRVGLLTQAAGFKLRLGGPMLDAEGRRWPADSAWELHFERGTEWTLRPLDGKGEPRRLGGRLRLEPLNPSATFGLFEISHGAGYFFARSENRYYRGALEIFPRGEGLTAVNELGMESYLASVVPSEVPAGWPAAALRAQAVAARTHAWASLGSFRAQGYDLCPTVKCAVYAGVGNEQPSTTAAVTRTAGLVLQKGAKLATTFYMDNSGGHTLGSEEAWPGSGARIPGVPDCPPGARSTLALFPLNASGLLRYIDDLDSEMRGWAQGESGQAWRWSLLLDPADLDAALRRLGLAGPLKGLQDLERSAGGYLRRMKLLAEGGEALVAGDKVRSTLKGLKSNLFYAELRLDPQGKPRSLLLHGGGWGHGVGLSQSGARGMAEAGYSAERVLRHYFPGFTLSRRYPR